MKNHEKNLKAYLDPAKYLQWGYFLQKCLTAFSKNIAKILQVSCGFVRGVRCLAQS